VYLDELVPLHAGGFGGYDAVRRYRPNGGSSDAAAANASGRRGLGQGMSEQTQRNLALSLDELEQLAAAGGQPVAQPPMPHGGTHSAEASPRLPADEQVSEVLRDWEWAYQGLESGALDLYKDRFVAVIGERVVAVGDDPLGLRRSVSEQSGVHPERVVVFFVGAGDDRRLQQSLASR
jgi:hypothetical protein